MQTRKPTYPWKRANMTHQIPRANLSGLKPQRKATLIAQASSVFPRESTVLRAMRGDPRNGDNSSSSSSTEQGSGRNNGKPSPHRPIAPDNSLDSDSSDSSSESLSSDSDSSFSLDFFDEEPSTVATNNSDRTKARKREKRHHYCAKLNKLKYQQSFLKEDPPFTYHGEIQVGLFKKWCHELHDWVKCAQLKQKKSICLAGKYLDGCAYRFYERNILDLKKRYTLTTFFEALLDYVFPADFRMQQRDKFDACHQGRWSILDFLRKLQEIADTVGDIHERDVVLAFWRHCQHQQKTLFWTVLDRTTQSNRFPRLVQSGQLSPDSCSL